MENVRAELLNWIGLTCVLICACLAFIINASWNLGRDYIIKGNKGKRLNFIQKFFDGFHTFLKM